MQWRNRVMRIDVCDYKNNIKCNLYDNGADISGQATDVFIKRQRNGWKEVNFALPSTCMTDEGEEENYRLAYLIPDYRLRVTTDEDGEDYYLITDETVRHQALSKKETIVAGHISQLLKTRAMDLEFSDAEGNNVGTAKQLLTTILEGTGWSVGKVAAFYEEDGKTIKVRSMNAAPKTGAFRLIEQMAELFEAKPIYNADYTVDILPMNPFSKLEEGEIPEAVYPNAAEDERFLVNSNVIELHYDKQIKELERKRNTENISTRLYGYGAYGDTVNKYCSLQTATHEEYVYIIEDARRSEYQVTDSLGVKRYFTAYNLEEGDELIWSMLDPTSQSYVWNETKQEAYRIYDSSRYQVYTILKGETRNETNYFPYLSDYTYYDEVGLLDEEAFQSVAKFQRDMAKYYKASIEAQEAANTTNEKLSRTGVPKSGYLKLDVDTEKCDHNVITIRKSEEYPDGVIWRSDYLQKEKYYFRWDVAQGIKANGMPKSTNASIIYVLKAGTDPVQWQRAYLKDIDGRQHTDVDGKIIHDGYDYQLSEGDKPHVLTLWSDLDIGPDDDVYLFGTDSISGRLSGLLSTDEGVLDALEDATTVAGTVKCPVTFIDIDEPLPEINFRKYGWCYRYNSTDYDTPGTLYFSWPERNDVGWKNAYVQDSLPDIDDGAYLYHTKYRTLWHCEGEWVKLETVDDQEAAKAFGVVFQQCRKRDQIYKGTFDNYYYTQNSALAQGSYAFPTSFGYYWIFTTDQTIPKDGTLRLDTTYNHIYQDDDVNHILVGTCCPYDTLIFPEENDLSGADVKEGSIYINNEAHEDGTDMVTDRASRTNYIPVWPNETYEYSGMPENTVVVLYDEKRNCLGYFGPLAESGEFSTSTDKEYDDVLDPDGYVKFKKAAYIRMTWPNSRSIESAVVRLKGYDDCCFFDDVKYKILQPITHDEGEPVGINSMIKQFRDLTDKLYTKDIPAQQAAQKVLIDENEKQVAILGDILREGWWQDGSYVDGDEQRMYNDALDNLKKISHPDTDYTFEYIDLYGSRDMSIRELQEVEWPDIRITDAPHLVDPDLHVNQWAYFNEINKCYDQPWKTSITIDTHLTLMGQHEFKDVLTRIAEVASETKAKQTLYQRAENIAADGTIAAEQISGTIDTADVQLTGSGFVTDEKGNLILESADGLAALQFNGSGLTMANSRNADGDWEWKSVINGFGIVADSITSGEINGRMVKANSIRADSLMANVGNELDIGSNKALNLYATLDGVKPAGSLKTTDAIIQIKAGESEDDRAAINIASGGSINLLAGENAEDEGASINIGSGGSINMLSGSDINMSAETNITMASGSNINIEAESGIHLAAGGSFTVESGNFNIDEDGNVAIGGQIHTEGATLGGWNVSDEHIGNGAEAANSSVGLKAPKNPTDVVIWAGETERNKAPFKVQANGAVESSDMKITGGSFTISKNVNDETVDNVKIDDEGFRVGWRTPESGETEGVDNYNFIVNSEGQATATGLVLKGGSLDNCTGTIGEGSTISSATFENGAISGGTLTNAQITGGEIVNTPIRRGEIHIGTLTNEETGAFDEKFTVASDGTVSINKGTINIGSNFSVNDQGVAQLKNCKVGGFTFDANGNPYCTTGNAEDELHFMTSPKSDPNSTIAGRNYLMWAGASEPAADGCVLRFSKIGSVFLAGNCSIGKSGGSSTLKVNGTTVTSSSRDYKKNIQPLQHRDEFDKIEPVSFQYNESNDTHYGMIYEDMVDLYPEVCFEDEDGSKGIAYTDMIAVLIKEVQDLRKRVAELERK